MAETDLLSNLLSSHPSEPVTKGEFMLSRMETKSEFKTLRAEMNLRLDSITRDLTEVKADVAGLKADVAVLKADVAGLKADVAVLKADVAGLKADVAVIKTDMADLKRLLRAVIEQVGILVEKSV